MEKSPADGKDMDSDLQQIPDSEWFSDHAESSIKYSICIH